MSESWSTNEYKRASARIDETKQRYNSYMAVYFYVALLVAVVATAGLFLTRLYLYQ